MRRIDLLYENLLLLLEKFSFDDQVFILYSGAQTENRQSLLIDICETILTEKHEISNAHLNIEFYPDFTNLIECLDRISIEFGDYPGHRKFEIDALICIIQKLTDEYSGSLLDLSEDVNHEVFGLLHLSDVIAKDNYYFFDSLDFSNSLCLFNIFEIDIFRQFVSSITDGVNILFYLLGKIGRTDVSLVPSKYILVKAGFIEKPKLIWATLCLHVIRSGQTIHRSSEYNLPPKIPFISIVTLGNDYQQFADSIDIISEYNSQKDIFDKYLRIYHVLENFMYKYPLVSLERKSNGQVFSVRDFKRMYDKINKSELEMLKKVFEEISLLNYSQALTFAQKIFQDWQSLIPGGFVDDTNINILISKLNLTKSNGDDIDFSYVNQDNIKHFLPKLIYAFRNSMVHNRETEFHLTHLNLVSHPIMSDAAKIVLEDFLLPVMEEIVFFLISNQNVVVWYNGSNLLLWDEN
jgi:hypothetical protein